MPMNTIKINAPIAPTYRWLRMNETEAAVPVFADGAAVDELCPTEIRRGGAMPAGLKTGMGQAFDEALDGAPARVYTVPAGLRPEEPLRLSFAYTRDAADRVAFVLEDGAALTVVMDYRAERPVQAAVRVLAQIGAGAVLRLVQVQRLAGESVFFNDLGGSCAEDGRLELVRLVLEGETTYDGCSVALTGNRSSLDLNVGYLVTGDGRLDMNVEAVHTGKKTRSDIYASGVLRDRAAKLFRGTIDLKKGCAGAEGNENEDVLLMDETTRSRTVPVILCVEEDVVGNHGCTIGRLDENLIFYLQSRGMTPEEIYEMMARARIDAVIRKIPDEATRRALLHEEETT